MRHPVPEPGAVPDRPDVEEPPLDDPQREPGDVPDAPDDPADPPAVDGPLNSA